MTKTNIQDKPLEVQPEPTSVDAAINHQPEKRVIGSIVWPEDIEPQDEWGPWIGWNGGECPVDGDTEYGTVECVFNNDGFYNRVNDRVWQPISKWFWREGCIIAYRVKLGPDVKHCVVWLEVENGFFHSHVTREGTRRAIITKTGNKLSIDWVDP